MGHFGGWLDCWWFWIVSNFGILWIEKTELPLQVEMWENASWALVSHTGRRERRTLLALMYALLSPSPAGPPPACYSPSSPVQILEDPNYFFSDFPLYSGRHEASALTVEANSTIREKVGKFFYWHLCWKSNMILCVSFLAPLHNLFSVILKISIWHYDCLLAGALFLMFVLWC